MKKIYFFICTVVAFVCQTTYAGVQININVRQPTVHCVRTFYPVRPLLLGNTATVVTVVDNGQYVQIIRYNTGYTVRRVIGVGCVYK